MGLLDDPPYSANHDDARSLIERLSALLPDKTGSKLLTGRSGIAEAAIDWDGRMADVWPRILATAAALGRLRALVEEAQKTQPEEELFERLVNEKSDGGQPLSAVELWATASIWKREPLIDRKELRDNLRAMIDDDEGYRALFVLGRTPAGTSVPGKTQSRRFMSLLMAKGQLPRVHFIDNSNRAGTPMSVQELAQKIASSVASILPGVEAPQYDLVAQEQSVVTQFRGWLQGVSSSMTLQEWIVFDGFSSETASGPALQLIHDLASDAGDYLLGPIRVAVCGYEGSPPLASGALSESLRAPTEEEVKDFFGRMSRSLTKHPTDPAAIDVLFDTFVAESGLIADRDLAELGPSALNFVQRVYQEKTT